MWHTVETWIFDLDNTLYPAECNLFAEVDRRMGQFIAGRLSLDPQAARTLQKSYFREYGTTLRGLMSEHGVDADEYLDFVHAVDLSPVSRDPVLVRAIADLPGRKLVHTNASTDYALRILERLGIGGYFDGVFDIRDAQFAPKPDVSGYEALIERHGVNPARAVMVEDIARNLVPASRLGMTTVWLPTGSDWSADGAEEDHIDHVIDDIATWLQGVVRSIQEAGAHAPVTSGIG